MRRSDTHNVVYRKTTSQRHLTLPFDGEPRLVTTTKRCTCCKKHFPLAHFYFKSEYPDSDTLRSQCVQCFDIHNGRNKPKPSVDVSSSLIALF
jgi:hypothetical protein